MRQLCRQLMQKPPDDIAHSRIFKSELTQVLAQAPTPVVPSPLRKANGGEPLDTPAWDSRAQQSTMSDAPGVWSKPAEAPSPQLDTRVGREVSEIVASHLSPAALAAFELAPIRSALFTGPPGVGKTMTATFIASELRLPLITVDIASLMSSLLGRTGRNLQSVIDQALERPSVLLLDEFDAIARSRREDSDVGEVRRVVTVLLQQLDRWPIGGLLIAASNHPEALDQAVLRRFDQRIDFPMPDFDARHATITSSAIARIAGFPEALIERAATATQGWSHSAIDRWLTQTARSAILEGEISGADSADEIVNAMSRAVFDLFRERSEESMTFRISAAQIANKSLGMTQREIAPLLGVSHVTVGNYLRGSSEPIKQMKGGEVT